MANGPQTTVQHSVVIEDAGPSRKRLNFTVPASVVTEQIENQMEMLAAGAVLPGFRAGRAPRRLVEKKFGPGVREEAKNQIVSSAYSQAIQEHKIAVLGDPEGNEELANLRLEPGQEMKFHIEVEVMPEFEPPSMDGVEIFKPAYSPSDEQVNEHIGRMLVNDGTLEERAVAEPGDYCIGHGVMRNAEGKQLLELDGAVIQVPPPEKEGKGAILGVLVDDFAAQIGSPEPGRTLTVKATGPENHEHEEVRGTDLVIEFRVDQVQRIIPCPMADFLAKSGAESEEQLRDAVRNRLLQRGAVEQLSALRNQVARKLLEAVEFPLPERLTARQAERNLQMARMDLMYRGFEEQAIEERMAQLRSKSAQAAVRDLKLTFILARLAMSMQVQVTQDEVLGRIAQMAMERGVRPDALRQEIEKRNQIGFVAQQVREHKTMDALIARAKVTELPIDEFNARFAPEGAEKTAEKKSAPKAPKSRKKE